MSNGRLWSGKSFIWKRFWNVEIIDEGKGRRYWKWDRLVRTQIIKCDCGKVKESRLSDLKKWLVTSCWCMRWKHWKNKRPVQTTHWMYNTRPYRIRASMKYSCDRDWHCSYHRRWAKWVTYESSWITFEWWWGDNKRYYHDEMYFTRKDLALSFTKENCERTTHYNVSQLDLRK
jgi:hypothetical protein